MIAVGTLPLHLPSKLVLDLNNCYLVPALSMNIISGSCLVRDGYSFKSENNGCSIYMSNIFYGHAPLKSGLFVLNLDSSDTHIHNVEAKRCRVSVPTAITSTLEPFLTRIVTSTLANVRLIRSPYFKLQI